MTQRFGAPKPGWTPFHSAALANRPDAIRILVAHGADPQRTAPSGGRPVHMAINGKFLDAARRARLSSRQGRATSEVPSMPEFELRNIVTQGRKEVPDRTLLRVSLGALAGTVTVAVQIPGQKKPRVYLDLPIVDGKVRLPVKLAFLSYAREDGRFVGDLAKRLLQHGVLTWYDRKDLAPGDDWKRKIDDAIERSDYVLVFLSEVSVAKTGQFQRELKYAIEQRELRPEGTRYIIPIVIGHCEPPASLGDIHWVRTEDRGWFKELLRAMDS